MIPLSVVIPAYNEEPSIGSVVTAIRDFMSAEKVECEIIVVDDCSQDGTAAAAKAAGVTVISHPVNRGYGASLTTGLKRARYEHVLILDADQTYPIAEARKLLPFIGEFDMVVGARQGKHYHGSLIKRLSRHIFAMLLLYVTGEKIPDANSGLRIFKKNVVMQFEDDFCSGFSFTTTITIILLSNRYLIKFVPVEYRSRAGKSKVRHLRDTARTVQILLHTITYYNPVKAFLPFGVLSLALCAGCLVASLLGGGDPAYSLAAVLAFLASMFFMSFGMITYAVVKSCRQKRV